MAQLQKICLYVIYGGFAATLFSTILLDNSFFFPFITTKVLVFRAAVEIIFLAYLILNVASREYRPRVGVITALTAVFIAIAAISSSFGVNPSGSFWGDIERGDGLLMWLHLLAFLIVLTGVVREEKTFARLLDFSIGVAILQALFGLGQALGVKSLLATSGDRVDSTLGNAAFFAAYLLLHLGFAIYLFLYRKNWGHRIYYTLSGFLFLLLIPATQTRGAVIGLGVGVIFGAILLAASNWRNPRVRRASASLVLGVALITLLAFSVRREPWTKKIPGFERITSISLQERTAQTRLATWTAAWQGVREKPLTGWGLENFNMVFNKYFPPIIYEDAGSQVWFDRAHNVIFDRAVTTGILGLLAFLGLLFYPVYYLIRHHLKDPERRNAAIVFSALLVAYLIQDMFIFESAVTYIVLFSLLGFLSVVFLPQWEAQGGLFERRSFWIALAIMAGLTLPPILWYVNIYPAKVNIAAATAIRSNTDEEDFFIVIERHKKYLEAKHTYGSPEYRLNYIDFISQQLAPVGEIVEKVKPILQYTDEQLEKQLAEQPDDAKNWLLAMRHYNYTHASYADKKHERLEKALTLFPELVRLSPTRPHVFQEAGYTYDYLYRLAKEDGKTELAAESYQKAAENFQKTIDLNPKVYESYTNLIKLYLSGGETEKIKPLAARMEENAVNFRLPVRLRQLKMLARSYDNFHWLSVWSEEFAKAEPDSPQALIDWALAEAYLGHRDKAIEIAEKIKAFGGAYIAEGDEFIARVRSGFFEDQVK